MNDIDFALADTSPFGKCVAEVKTRLPDDADQALTMLASAHRMTKSEYVRNLLLEHIYGKAEILRRKIDPPSKS